MTKVVLYNYWRSSCSWRVRIALAWKGIEYEYKPIHLVKDGGEHFQEEFTKLNPNQRLPAVVIDGRVLSQSGAIIEYIEESHPERPLLPKDPFARAQVRSICLLIGADIQPVQNLAVMNKIQFQEATITHKALHTSPRLIEEQLKIKCGYVRLFWTLRFFKYGTAN